MPPLLHSICSFPSTGKSVFETSRTKPKACFLSHLTKNPTLSLKKQVCATSATFQDEISPEITTINLPDMKNYSKKKKKILEAYQLFETMTDRRIQPTPSTCKNLFYRLCDHGMFRKAVQIVEFMLCSGTLHNEICTSIIKKLTTIEAYEYAIQLLDEMEHRGCTLDPDVYGTLTMSLCRKADTRGGWHCLDKLIQKGFAPTDPDTILKLLEAAHLQGGGAYLVVSVLTQILLRGGEPDYRCYHKVLTAYKEDDLASEALELFSVLPPSLKYNLGIYNVLLNTLGYQGRWSEAEALLDNMMERGIMPNIETYKALISTIADRGYAQEALEIVEELGINGFKTDAWFFNPIIMRFCSEGQLNMVHKCLKSMERWNCRFNSGTYRAIALLCNRGMLDEAFKILESLRQKQGTELHSFYGKEVLQYLCYRGRGNTFEALQILTKLEQVRYTPDLQTCSYFVNGLCMEGFHEEAVEMFEVIDKYNVRTDMNNYNKLVLELCKGGRIDLAIMALEKMVMKGYEPTESTYVIIIEAIGNLERKDLVGELLRELYAKGKLSQESMEKISLKFCLDNVVF